jgi:NAD(P)-dependent dehydrogenase (short-subunit alcohol dehydrogenase family)
MKNILITGANGSLGTATVKKFLDEGYKVIAADNEHNRLAFAKNNSNFEVHTVNLSDEKAATAFVEDTIRKHGTIHGGLLLVGGFAMTGLDKTTGKDLKEMFSLNFETAYYIARPLFNHMMEKNYGRLVFMGARPALLASAGKDMVAYALSKSLLFKLAEFVNAEAKGHDVTASVIVPSTIDTKLNRESMPKADPSKWVKAEQLADIMEFICSEKGQPIRESIYKVYNNA